MKKTLARYVFMIALTLGSLGPTLSAQSFSVIVGTTPNADIHAIAAALGGSVLDSTDDNVYLLSLPAIPSIYPVGVKYIEPDSLQLASVGHGAIFSVSATTVSNFYREQPAMLRVKLGNAFQYATGRGVVIADINALVDVRHPALIGHLTSGGQFQHGTCTSGSNLNQSTGAFLDQSTGAFLDQSTGAFLDQSTGAFLDQSTGAFLDQSTGAFLDQSTASSINAMSQAHGHGTIVAGILAVMAPDAMIMPLQAFDDHGCGSTYNITKAVKYAVSHGAQVINMSFGIPSESQALKNAINQALKAGIVVVASAGNENTAAPQYPAAYPGVLGVAATTLTDVKASFSDYGHDVFVSAPGTNIISAYPGGYYAVVSGTSFSAPMVAAEAALLRSLNNSGWTKSIGAGVDHIDALNPGYAGELGAGRINLLKAVQ